jgi:hypothetical protein
MHVYDAMLFVHLVGVVLLFGAIALTQVGVVRLGRAATLEEARLWVGLTQIAGRLFPVAFVLILVGGLYMAGDSWSFGDPWIVVALVSLVILGVLGGGVVGRTLGSVGQALAGAAPGAHVPGDANAGAAVPGRAAGAPEFVVRASTSLRAPTMALTGVAIGVLWLMTNKPGWAVSIAVVAGLGLVGAVIGWFPSRQSAAPRGSA